MLPSLKDLHEQSLERLLSENSGAVEVLKEAIDQKMINEIEKALNKLTNIMRASKLENLDSFQLGIQKAHKELADLLSHGDIKGWLHSFLPTGFTALGRLTAFTTGITKLMKQLPTIVRVVKGSMDAERRAQWDPDKPIDQLLDSDATEKLVNIIVKAMEPTAGAFSLSTGLPYVNDKTAAAELLSLSYNQLNAFSVNAAEAAQIALKIRPQEIKNISKQDDEDENEEVTADTRPQIKRLVIPTDDQAAPAAPQTQQQKQAEYQVPTSRQLIADLDDVFDETLFTFMGVKGENSKNFQQFKPRFIKNFVMLMHRKRHIKPTK